MGTLAQIVHPEVEWHEPSGGIRRGHADLLDSWQGYSGQWSEFESSPERFLDADDHVIVLGSFRALAAATGIEVEVPFVHIYRLEDGRVVWGREFVDTAKERDALEGGAS